MMADQTSLPPGVDYASLQSALGSAPTNAPVPPPASTTQQGMGQSPSAGQLDPNMLMNALSKSQDSQKALVGQEQAELAPKAEALQNIYNQPMPKQPDLQAELAKAPGIKEYMALSEQVKKSSQEYMGTAGILSGLVGLFARKHTTLALKAFTAAVKGFEQGQGDAVKQQMEIFKQANQQAVENAKMLQDEYINAMNQRDKSAEEILNEMKATSEKYHDSLMAEKLSDGDFFKVQALLNQREKAGQSVMGLNEKITNQIEELQGSQKDAILDFARAKGGDMVAIADGAQQVLLGKEPMPTTGQNRNPINTGIFNLVNYISRATGKPFDAAVYKARQDALIKLAQSKVPPNIGATEQSISKVNLHLQTLQNAMTELNSGDVRMANQAAQRLAKEFGDPKIVDAQTAVSAVSQEFHRVYVPTGGVEDERAEAASNIDPSSSPQQIQGAIATMKELMTGQAKAIYLIDQTIQQGGNVAALNVPSSYITHVASLGPQAVSEGQAGSPSKPSQSDIDYLKSNPGVASQFDAEFGQDSSKQYLGQ